MDITKIVEERLSLFKNLYDVIRIIDPINKKCFVLNEDQELVYIEECFCFWKRSFNCENCVSMRAYLEDDTFVKVEYRDGKVYMVTSKPMILNDVKYVIEILKDISPNGYIEDGKVYNLHNSKSLIVQMNDKVITDELTGIYNRRYINERLIVDANRCLSKGEAISIIMVCIDLDKSIYGNYDHSTGDKVLRDFVKFLKSSIRIGKDWIGRYDDGEFLITLNNTSEEEALQLAEKIRKNLEEKVFIYGNLRINITSSFSVLGISCSKFDIETLIENMSRNLCKAKL